MRFISAVLLSCCLLTTVHAQNWPSFRGQDAAGVAAGPTLPDNWNVENSNNIRWKTPIPGLAHSSPIVWGNRIFLTTAVSNAETPAFRTKTITNAPITEAGEYNWRIYCIDKISGGVLWDKTAHEGVPRVKRHLKATQANSTPATDGKYVIAIFGSEGLYCFDLNGRLLWKQDLGILDPGLHKDARVQWGYASSPIIYQGLVIIQGDAHAQSFISAYDLKDGKQVWRVPRQEMPSWSSPTIYYGEERHELITNAPNFVRGYDPSTGRELWRFDNSELIVQVPTPFIANDMIYVTGGWPGGRPIKAFRPGANGDISGDSNVHLAWQSSRSGPYVPTPIVYGDYLYSCTDKGILTCFNARTGEQIYQHRINRQNAGFSASPVAADGRLYFASEDGDVYVVKAGASYELLAINSMGGAMMATPAISDGLLIIRTQEHLFGIAESDRGRTE